MQTVRSALKISSALSQPSDSPFPMCKEDLANSYIIWPNSCQLCVSVCVCVGGMEMGDKKLLLFYVEKEVFKRQ